MSLTMTSAEKLKILADRTRLNIMERLLEGPRRVGELANLLKIEQSLLSHHLKVLREAELVVSVRAGKAVTYKLSPQTESHREQNSIALGSYTLLLENARPRTHSK